MTIVGPHVKDAEAAGRYCVEFIHGRKRWAKDAPMEYIVWLARWAGHWGRRALRNSSESVLF